MTVLPERTDVLILGGGIQGATALYECARRGLSAILVERDDFGSGASSHSMKILHGGLRYLQHGDIRRSWESACEGARLRRIAPDYIRPLSCRLSLDGRGPVFRIAYRMGLAAQRGLNALARARVANAPELPGGGFPFWVDGFVDDTEALLFAFLRTAAEIGKGRVVYRNHTEAELLTDRQGRVRKARIGNREISVGAVLRCTGAGSQNGPAVVSANLVVARTGLLDPQHAVALRHPRDGRNVFAVPWRERTILGTWDRPYAGPADGLSWDPRWLSEILAWLAPVHPRLAELRSEDVAFIHAGVLPAGASGEAPAEESRVRVCPDGTLSVQTVKWTTARRVASRAVRLAAARLGLSEAARIGDSELTPLQIRPVQAEPGAGDSAEALAERVRRAVRDDAARSLSDLLLRRSGVASAGLPEPGVVARYLEAMAAECGWDEAQAEAQLDELMARFEFSAGFEPSLCHKAS